MGDFNIPLREEFSHDREEIRVDGSLGIRPGAEGLCVVWWDKVGDDERDFAACDPDPSRGGAIVPDVGGGAGRGGTGAGERSTW